MRWQIGVAVTGLLAASVLVAVDARQQAGGARPQGPYLGQTPPGTTPQVFAPGFVSTAEHEFACSWTPDGREFYFTRGGRQQATRIMVTRSVDGTWTEPAAAPFNDSPDHLSFEPLVTPDNQRLYFSSSRPLDPTANPAMPEFNTWFVERKGAGWGRPKAAGAPFNPMRSMFVSMTRDGTVYTADISNGPGRESLATARLENGKYRRLETLGPPLNVGVGNLSPFIAPDERYIVFTTRRLDPTGTLVVSFRGADGTWGTPRPIELGMTAGLPVVSPDGRYLFFTAGERGRSDIYWVSARVFDPSVTADR